MRPDPPRFPVERHAAPIWSCSRWGLPCQRRYRRCGALLPHRFTLAWAAPVARLDPSAVSFLWHCPWGRPRRPLAATVHPWSPDFPPPARDCQNADAPAAAVRPAGGAHKAEGSRGVKGLVFAPAGPPVTSLKSKKGDANGVPARVSGSESPSWGRASPVRCAEPSCY